MKKLYIAIGLLVLVSTAWALNYFGSDATTVATLHGETNYLIAVQGSHSNSAVAKISVSNLVNVLNGLPIPRTNLSTLRQGGDLYASNNVTVAGTTALGVATATTPAENDNDTSVATTAYVQAELGSIGAGLTVGGGDVLENQHWSTNGTLVTRWSMFVPSNTWVYVWGSSLSAGAPGWTTPLFFMPGWSNIPSAQINNRARSAQGLAYATNEMATNAIHALAGAEQGIAFLEFGVWEVMAGTDLALTQNTLSNMLRNLKSSNYTTVVFDKVPRADAGGYVLAETNTVVFNEWLKRLTNGLIDVLFEWSEIIRNPYDTNIISDGVHLTQWAQSTVAQSLDWTFRNRRFNGPADYREPGLQRYGWDYVLRDPYNATRGRALLTVRSNSVVEADEVRATVDASATGTTIKQTGYIVLSHPHNADNAGAVLQTNDVTAATFGQALFSNSADLAANYVEYRITVPEDIDTAIDLKVARWKFQLNNADTGTHRYVISMSSAADSAAYAGSLGQSVNLDFAGDASGANGDVETVSNVTLTDWKANVTAGRLWVIRVARDGDASEDASTVSSHSGPLVISYGKSQ